MFYVIDVNHSILITKKLLNCPNFWKWKKGEHCPFAENLVEEVNIYDQHFDIWQNNWQSRRTWLLGYSCQTKWMKRIKKRDKTRKMMFILCQM